MAQIFYNSTYTWVTIWYSKVHQMSSKICAYKLILTFTWLTHINACINGNKEGTNQQSSSVVSWASAPMGRTRHLPGQGIWHLRNFRYKIANLNKKWDLKSDQIVFCSVQNMVCPPKKTALRTPMCSFTKSIAIF